MKMLDVPQSGSLAQKTSSRNRFGQYKRTRATPVNPNSASQVEVRARLQYYSTAWRDLTDAGRSAWNNYAAEHPKLDSLGQTIFWTGFQTFVGINVVLRSAGLNGISVPPADASVPTPEFAVDDSTAAALSLSVVADVVDATVVVRTSPPVSQGVSFNGDYRIVNTVANPSADDPILTAAQLTAKWGTLIPGQKFFVRVTAVAELGNVSGNFEKAIVLT
jgi:hypothetical protein